MLQSIHRQGYRAPDIRRVYIPKPGKTEKRPLGVPTVADRALQRSTAEVPALGFAGMSLSMASGACASTSEASANTSPPSQKHETRCSRIRGLRANQDVARASRPGRRLARRPRQHISFGFGIHRCVGNRLAEMQLRILWEEILKRGRMIEVVGEPERVPSNFVRGYPALPVRISA
jgi:hypothetical protein